MLYTADRTLRVGVISGAGFSVASGMGLDQDMREVGLVGPTAIAVLHGDEPGDHLVLVL